MKTGETCDTFIAAMRGTIECIERLHKAGIHDPDYFAHLISVAAAMSRHVAREDAAAPPAGAGGTR